MQMMCFGMGVSDWIGHPNQLGRLDFPFLLNETDLYLLTFMQDNQHPEIYQRTLYAISDSFQFVGEKDQESN